MGICDYMSSTSPQWEFEDIRDFANDMLAEWGFDEPNWSDTMLPGHEGVPAIYDSITNTIHLDVENFAGEDNGDFPLLVSLGIHEALHYTIEQLGWTMNDSDEEALASTKGLDVLLDLVEGCENPTDSGAPSNMPQYPWISTGNN